MIYFNIFANVLYYIRWVLSIPFFISCIRQQNPLTVLSKIILRKVKQFNLPPPKKKMRDFCIFEHTPRLVLLGNRQFTFIAHNLDVAEDVVGQICHRSSASSFCLLLPPAPSACSFRLLVIAIGIPSHRKRCP